MKIVWSPLAVERVSEIVRYIAEDNPDAATNWAESIFTRVEQLGPFPDSGNIVPEMHREDIRQLVMGNYRIIYRIGTDQISVLTVRHHRQILPDQELR